MGDDSSSIHSSAIKPISSGRIRGCAVLIRPPHPIRAPAGMSFIKPFSHCCVWVCVRTRSRFHSSFFIPQCLFINLSNLCPPSSVTVCVCVSVIAIKACCLKAWLRIHRCCFFLFSCSLRLSSVLLQGLKVFFFFFYENPLLFPYW